MSVAETIFSIQAQGERCQDRLAVFNEPSRTVIVVADGAGGIGCGDLAAQTIIDEIKNAYQQIHSAQEWQRLLRQLDTRVSDGESTAVVVDIRPFGIAGASVGDSRAMIVVDGKIDELTKGQNRKPLLGTGNAQPVEFFVSAWSGLLLVGTDGFFSYAKPERILDLVARADFVTIPRRCIEMVRLPSGEYWDDIAIVAARTPRQRATRKKYTIDE